MGAWGTGIFQDDTACDLRDDYRVHLGNGLSGPEAAARILSEYAGSFADPEQSGVVWLALAATQWRCGRLEPETLKKALEVIDSGSDLARWKAGSPADYGRRRMALEKLRRQLILPQPPAKKIRRQVPAECDWQVGELISYRLQSGSLALFRVIGHHIDKGGAYPKCELLDWSGEAVPPADRLQSMPIRKSNGNPWSTITRLMLLGSQKTVKERIERLHMTLPPEQKELVPCTVVLWKQLDAKLADWFGLQ